MSACKLASFSSERPNGRIDRQEVHVHYNSTAYLFDVSIHHFIGCESMEIGVRVNDDACAEIVGCTVQYARSCAVYFGRGCRGRVLGCSMPDIESAGLRAHGVGCHVQAFNCTMNNCCEVGITARTGATLVVHGCNAFGVTDARSVLWLIGCTGTGGCYGRYPKNQGILIAHEVHASAGKYNLIAMSGAHVKVGKCTLTESSGSGIFTGGQHIWLHAEDCTLEYNGTYGIVSED